MPGPDASAPPPRIQIQRPSPLVDCGRYAAKACVGDAVPVEADIFRDGHDVLRAIVRWRRAGERRWREAPMVRTDAHLDGDRWAGEIAVDACGRHEVTIEAWTDRFASWHDEVRRKVAADQPDLAGELSEGAVLLEAARERASGEDAALIAHALRALTDAEVPQQAKLDAVLGAELLAAVERHPDRQHLTRLAAPLPLDVERPRARFGAWYELFPRSWGGFKGVEKHLDRFAELGFDVLYFPPIHPIGRRNRKGKNNALKAGRNDPGSPWAIGNREEGGHEAIHPELGTFEDFDRLVAAARERDIEIALDFAIQCSADHPWLTEHPEWFQHRPDGTLKYAENPPKRYQDIYNVDWDCEDWPGLWDALLGIVRHWVAHGVKVFRVDNPHTKPFGFWEWLIAEIHRDDPDVVFLAEAFTRRKVMQALAKLGFSQSYTYFTWKNGRHELSEYVSELANTEERFYFRPNFFANTPDILTSYLATGGQPAFEARLVLAATLSPSYGIYSGYESSESVPVRPDSEEYLNSEKYEVKRRRLDGALLPMIARLNAVRREHPALQRVEGVTFLDTHNDGLVAYAKQQAGDTVLCVVNLDPHNANEGVAVVPAHLGLAPSFAVEDVLGGERYDWRIGPNYVRLAPGERQAHVLAVVR
ncbi:MAG: alpha,4-glucan--maltose-phosphate maltosyltransferase [Solirubrobacterales bacterium]|nr:alpha,4-glucan--maltose-phosphate maltosyltransferase [Solirubrobacterales bacterium]